jgi:hypothetical protein
LIAASLLAGCVVPDPPAPPPPPRLTLHELVAVRRLDAHDAAVRRNAAAKQACERWHAIEADLLRIPYRTLYGARGTPGTAFDEDSGSSFVAWIDKSGANVVVTRSEPETCWPNEDPEVFCPFQCRESVADNCGVLAGLLEEAWGPSQSETWLDSSGTVRATVRAARDCTLEFQSYVRTRAWIAMTATAEIPLALLGEPMEKLPARAEEIDREDDGHRFQWRLAVTGEHVLRAEILAIVNDGRIVRLEVRGDDDEVGGPDELHELVRPFRRVQVSTWADQFELVAE